VTNGVEVYNRKEVGWRGELQETGEQEIWTEFWLKNRKRRRNLGGR